MLCLPEHSTAKKAEHLPGCCPVYIAQPAGPGAAVTVRSLLAAARSRIRTRRLVPCLTRRPHQQRPCRFPAQPATFHSPCLCGCRDNQHCMRGRRRMSLPRRIVPAASLPAASVPPCPDGPCHSPFPAGPRAAFWQMTAAGPLLGGRRQQAPQTKKAARGGRIKTKNPSRATQRGVLEQSLAAAYFPT